MDEKARKKLVNIVWKELEDFIKEWQRSPFVWNKERDVQVELANRIKSAIKGKDKYWANYKCITDKVKGFEQGQEFSRVCCEPLVYYKNNKGKRDVCFPDIVICDAPDNPVHPQELWKKKRNDPIIWICEIKYQREWKKPYSSEIDDIYDLEKIKYLLKQEDGTKYACWLNMSRTRASSGNGFPKPIKDCRVRVYNVTLPSRS